MIKILSISSSPVENSSTDIILKELQKSISEELKNPDKVKFDFIKLNDLNFIPCQACGEDPSPKFCFFDGLDEVYKLLEECDCLLFGSPVYFDSVSAQAKSFIDRCNCFRPPDYKKSNPSHLFLKRLNRKRPGAIILVGGENGYFEGARRVVAGFFKWVEVVNEGLIVYQTNDFNKKGTVVDNQATLSEIKTLAKHLAIKLTKDYV